MGKTIRCAVAWMLTLAMVCMNVDYVRAESVLEEKSVQMAVMVEGTNAKDMNTEELDDTLKDIVEDVASGDVVSVAAANAAEAGENIASGTWRGMDWVIDGEGLLTISGVCTNESSDQDTAWWDDYAKDIVSAKVTATNVKDINGWFRYCENLSSIDMSNFDTSKFTDMSYMFSGCKNIVSIDLSGFDTSQVTDMSYMFHNCSNLHGLDISGFDTRNVVTMSSMFDGCSSMTNLNIKGINTSKVTCMIAMFYNCNSLTNLDLSGLDTSNVTNMHSMFYGCNMLKEVNLSGLDMGYVTDMSYMFQNCSSLISLNLNGIDTRNVQGMDRMFSGCNSLIDLNLNGFDTSNVRSMYGIFANCSSLTNLDLKGFNTSNLGSTSYMFSGCSNLIELDLSNFDTSGVSTMDSMFEGCKKLSAINLSGFDTHNVSNMDCMFQDCSSLTKLDLGFDMIRIGLPYHMFDNCWDVKQIKVFRNLQDAFTLPVSPMYDIQGNEYTTFPTDLSESIWLYATKTQSSGFMVVFSPSSCDVSYKTGEGYSREYIAPEFKIDYNTSESTEYKNLILKVDLGDGLYFKTDEGNTTTATVEIGDVASNYTAFKGMNMDAYIDSAKYYSGFDIKISFSADNEPNLYETTFHIDVENKPSDNSPLEKSGSVESTSYGKVTYNNAHQTLYQSTQNFESAMDDYVATLRNQMRNDTGVKGKKTHAQILRDINEASGIDGFEIAEGILNEKEKQCVYEAYAEFLDDLVETGQVNGKIKVDISENDYKISEGIIKSIINKTPRINKTYICPKHNYSVRINVTFENSAYIGWIAINGSNVAQVHSSLKDTTNTMNAYISELAETVNDINRKALTSVIRELLGSSVTGISDFIKKDFESVLVNSATALQESGYGNVLTTAVALQRGYNLNSEIAALAKGKISITDLDDLEKRLNSLSDFSDKTVKKEVVSSALKKLSEAKKELSDDLYEYIYNPEGGGKKKTFLQNVCDGLFGWIHCPVDFNVLDEEGNIIGYVSDGAIFTDGTIEITVNGGEKGLYIPYGKRVTIQFIGTNDGTMNYIVEQYRDGVATGRLNYYNIPLTEGGTFTQEISAWDLTGDTAQMPLSIDESVINADEYIDAAQISLVHVGTSCVGEGTTDGADYYATGDLVELYSYPKNEFYRLEGWYVNDSLVETAPIYRFTAIEDVAVTAKFESVDVQDTSFGPVQMGEKYEDWAWAVIYKTEAGKDKIDLRLYGSETEVDYSTVVVNKYDSAGAKSTGNISTTTSDGGSYWIHDVNVDECEKVEVVDATGNTIAAFTKRVVVKDVSVTSVALDKQSASLKVGETTDLTAIVVPEDATDKAVVWSSSDDKIAEVDDTGKVTAKAKGTATITVTTVDGRFSAACEVTVSAEEPETLSVNVTAVALDKQILSLKVKETAQLTATVSPDNATDKSVTWSSSDAKIATVDATGKVTAIAKGTTIITVTTKDGSHTATCTVTVTEDESGTDTSEPEPNPASVNTLVVKQKLDITDRFMAATPYKKYIVTPKGTATVTSKGILTAKKPNETVVITGLVKDGKVWKEAESVTLKIEAPTITQKTITATKAGAIINASDNIAQTTVNPTNWISSKPAVAEIDAKTGVITTKAKGTTKITAVYGEGKNAAKYTFSVKVNIPVPSKTKATALTGATLKLKLKNVPKDRTAEIQWESSDSKAAEVDSTGKVTVLAYNEAAGGKVTITATIDAVPYSCEIEVKKPEIKKNTLVIKQGKSGKVALKNTKLKGVKWTSSNEKIATVDEKGKVTGVAPGTVTIQTTAGGVASKCEVTVQ